MSDFTVHLPTQVLFGCGRLAEAGPLCVGKGTRACLVTGSQPERADVLRDELAALGLDPHVVPVAGEPSLKFAEEACASARDAGCDLVVSCGGGSVLDAGKAIAAFLTNGGALIDYLEGVGGGQPLTHRAAFHLAIPTTAGTGAEVTKNAVLGVTEQRVKVSMRSDLMFPHIALVDPELTRSAPESVTIAAGLDALTQLVEAYITPFANPVTDGLCREGLIRAGRSIRQVVAEPDDLAARADLSLAACFSGMALALAKLGVVHGIAGPLGGMFPAPHGAVCARLLAPAMRANLAALRSRAPESEAVERLARAGQWLSGSANLDADGTVLWIEALCADLQVPSLSLWGVLEAEREELIAKAQSSSSMKGNPIVLTDDEVRALLSVAH